MKNNKRLVASLALALAGALLWANLGWAQAQGGSCCPAAKPASGNVCQVQGKGAVCPVIPNPNSPLPGAQKQAPQGKAGEQAPPVATQPETGK